MREVTVPADIHIIDYATGEPAVENGKPIVVSFKTASISRVRDAYGEDLESVDQAGRLLEKLCKITGAGYKLRLSEEEHEKMLGSIRKPKRAPYDVLTAVQIRPFFSAYELQSESNPHGAVILDIAPDKDKAA